MAPEPVIGYISELIFERKRALMLEEHYPTSNPDESEDKMRNLRADVEKLTRIREDLENTLARP